MFDGLKESALTIGLVAGALLLIGAIIYLGVRFARDADKEEDALEKANEKIAELEKEQRP